MLKAEACSQLRPPHLCITLYAAAQQTHRIQEVCSHPNEAGLTMNTSTSSSNARIEKLVVWAINRCVLNWYAVMRSQLLTLIPSHSTQHGCDRPAHSRKHIFSSAFATALTQFSIQFIIQPSGFWPVALDFVCGQREPCPPAARSSWLNPLACQCTPTACSQCLVAGARRAEGRLTRSSARYPCHRAHRSRGRGFPALLKSEGLPRQTR